MRLQMAGHFSPPGLDNRLRQPFFGQLLEPAKVSGAAHACKKLLGRFGRCLDRELGPPMASETLGTSVSVRDGQHDGQADSGLWEPSDGILIRYAGASVDCPPN